MEPRLQIDTRRRKHTLASWTVLIGFALFSFWGFVRLVDSVMNWYWYTFAGIQPGPWYLAASGGLWGICGLLALIWLFFALPHWRQVASGAALLYALSCWLDRLLVSKVNGGLSNGMLPALVTLLCIGYVIAVLRPWEGIQEVEG